MNNKVLYQIALTLIKGVGVMHARNLMEIVGDEETIFRESRQRLKAIPRLPEKVIDEIRNPEVLRRAEKELTFVTKNNLQPLFFTDSSYPQRLTQCIDAPVLLYARGDCDLNRSKVVGVVGTRNATRQGTQFCESFIRELSESNPDILIISGLAYGIDICAHRTALKEGLSTVAVLAHGLDRIYPSLHRQTAVEMLKTGALLTEFPSETNPDRHNFVKRNRIVAGMADAVVVIESGVKGGSLTTADIANSYFREVFALPGRVKDPMSAGCNRLIADNQAVLLHSSKQFLAHMGWEKQPEMNKETQKKLFMELSAEEEQICQLLDRQESMQVNNISVELNIPVTDLFLTLLELEVKNVVKALPGGVYCLA